jgi:DNA-binding response OmpR family regulator
MARYSAQLKHKDSRIDDRGAPSREVAQLDTLLAGVALLVVEDDDLSREALGLLFSHYGARVCTAASLDEALACFDRHPPDMVVSDIGLDGDHDGFRLIRHVRMRDSQRGSWTPAIAVSGLSPGEGPDPHLAGFDDFLRKPVDVGLLVARVQALLERERGRTTH